MTTKAVDDSRLHKAVASTFHKVTDLDLNADANLMRRKATLTEFLMTQKGEMQNSMSHLFRGPVEAAEHSKGMQAIMAKHETFLAEYKKLQDVLFKNGLNQYTGDGSIFEDGQGITATLYDQYVVAGTTVCETGLGMGLGALYSLLLCKDCQIYVFDNQGHPYAKATAEYLQKRFPNRLTVTWGDSTTTLPEFKKAHPDVKCDFVMIDGGRSYDISKADAQNFATLVSSAATPVLQHDVHVPNFPDSTNGVTKGWNELSESGCVKIEKTLPTVSIGHLDGAKCGEAKKQEPSGISSWVMTQLKPEAKTRKQAVSLLQVKESDDTAGGSQAAVEEAVSVAASALNWPTA